MDNIINGLGNLLSVSGLLALLNIIIIDIVMSGDNAIIIGMATRNLPLKIRKKAIMIGILLATIMRIVLAFFAVYLLGIIGLKLAGGVLLLYVVWKFYSELRNGNYEHNEQGISKTDIGFMSAIYTIIIADLSMSLDNVLAVAGAAHGNILTLGIGLVISIILMAFASNYIAKNLNKYPQIQWVGLLVILFVAIEMMITGTEQLEKSISISNLLPFVIFIISSLFIVLYQKKIVVLEEVKIKNFLDKHYIKVFMGFIISTIILLAIGDIVTNFLKNHEAIFLAILFILLGFFLEFINLIKRNK
ncbi:MAG: TerC family protein [Candidatus Gracilibacteria bacterium]|nr:TerC family protein [Candidatus Gracilibacteria bacterium]